MNTRTSLIAISVPAAFCIAACQSWQPDGQALRVVPVEPVRHGTSLAQALYAVGRYHQGQQRDDKAIETYTRLLVEYPDHAEAHNALGMLLARQGRYEAAIGELEKAVAHAPDSASMRNNLGYAYLLNERVDEAIVVLKVAAGLDPANPRVRDNLELALARGGQGESASGAVLLGAVEPVKPVGPAVIPAAQQNQAVASPSPGERGVAGSRNDNLPEQMQLVEVATNVFSLQPPTPRKMAATLPKGVPESPVPARESTGAADPAGKGGKLEVSNGNGITGLAKTTSGHLRAAGYGRTRLTNDMPYRQQVTEIQYRPGFEPLARELQASLRNGIPLVVSTQLRADVHMRLLLGKDVSSVNEVLAQAPSPAMQLATAAP